MKKKLESRNFQTNNIRKSMGVGNSDYKKQTHEN